MPGFIKVARYSEIPEGQSRCVEVKGVRVALFNCGGTIFATQESCTHAEASLCEGDLAGEEIVCPLHFATFNVRTGECTGPPADEDLITYEVRVENGDVEVRV